MDRRYKNVTEAVALSYDEDNPKSAPFVAAKGDFERAQAIVEMAEELGLYIHQDEKLLRELKSLKEGEEVPSQLFGVIATILAFSYILQGKTPKTWRRRDGTRAINLQA